MWLGGWGFGLCAVSSTQEERGAGDGVQSLCGQWLNQSSLHNEASIESMAIEAWVYFLGWQYPTHVTCPSHYYFPQRLDSAWLMANSQRLLDGCKNKLQVCWLILTRNCLDINVSLFTDHCTCTLSVSDYFCLWYQSPLSLISNCNWKVWDNYTCALCFVVQKGWFGVKHGGGWGENEMILWTSLAAMCLTASCQTWVNGYMINQKLFMSPGICKFHFPRSWENF